MTRAWFSIPSREGVISGLAVSHCRNGWSDREQQHRRDEPDVGVLS